MEATEILLPKSPLWECVGKCDESRSVGR